MYVYMYMCIHVYMYTHTWPLKAKPCEMKRDADSAWKTTVCPYRASGVSETDAAGEHDLHTNSSFGAKPKMVCGTPMNQQSASSSPELSMPP
jgi:hypothetical protein